MIRAATQPFLFNLSHFENNIFYYQNSINKINKGENHVIADL